MANRYNKPGWQSQTRGLQTTLLPAGAAINTNIALAGARKNKDTILGAINMTDLVQLELPAITSDGNIQFPTTVTTAKKVLIFWDATSD